MGRCRSQWFVFVAGRELRGWLFPLVKLDGGEHAFVFAVIVKNNAAIDAAVENVICIACFKRNSSLHKKPPFLGKIETREWVKVSLIKV